MKPTIRVSIGGIAFNLDEDAYKLLASYLEALKRHFAQNEESEEIISDIELRLSELLQMRVSLTNDVVSAKQAEEIVSIMGNPKDFGDELQDDATGEYRTSTEVPPHTPQKENIFNFRKKKLYRDTEERVVGGVCSGLGHYFRVDSVIIRIIFTLLLFSGSVLFEEVSATVFIIYIILWTVMPRATTFEDKLIMTGEDPSILNIEDRNRRIVRRNRGSGIGEIVRGFFKIVLIMAAVILLVGLVGVIGFFGWMNFDTEVMNSLNYLVLVGLDTTKFKIAVLLLCILPIIAIISLLYKMLRGTSFKTQNGVLLAIGVTAWLVSVSYVAGIGMSVGSRAKNRYVVTEEVPVKTQAKTFTIRLDDEYKKTEEQPNNAFMYYKGLKRSDREVCLMPSVIIRQDSTITNYEVKFIKEAYGKRRSLAVERAENMNLDYTLNDSVLIIKPEWYMSNKPWDFSNLKIEIFVPLDANVELDDMLDRQKRELNTFENTFFNFF